jgi:DNA-binding HxlR family transcriptional regulator
MSPGFETTVAIMKKSIAGSPCETLCPVRVIADILEHKWATLIIRELLGGKKRFSELGKSLGTISTKILSERLRELEENHMVVKHMYPTIPPTSEYELSDLGRELEHVIRAMDHVGKLLMEANKSIDMQSANVG